LLKAPAVRQPRSDSLQAATSGDLKVAATSAIEITKQELSTFGANVEKYKR